MALVTDYDTGLEGMPGVEPVTMEAVFAMLARNVEGSKALLMAAIPRVPTERSCSCGSALSSGPHST